MSFMEQTVVLIGHAFGNQFSMPGFVRIDEARVVDPFGRTEFYVVYDTDDLDNIYDVTVSNSSTAPPSPSSGNPTPTQLGKLRIFDDNWAYVWYYAMPRGVGNPEWSMTIQTRLAWSGVDLYVAGFVAIDDIRATGEHDYFDMVVRYKPGDPDLHKLTVSATGPSRELQPGQIDLGVHYTYGLPRYVRYTDEIVTP